MSNNSNQPNTQQQSQKFLILEQHSFLMYSVDHCIVNQFQRRSAVTRKCNKQTIGRAVLIVVIWGSLLQLTTCSLSTYAPTVGYNDPQIFTGKFTLSTNTLTPFIVGGFYSQMSYNISINFPTTYSIHIGIHALSVQNIASSNRLVCWIFKNHTSDTILQVNARYDNDLIFSSVGINYFAIEPNYFSTAIEYIESYVYHGFELNSSNSHSLNLSLSNIKSDHTYKVIELQIYIYLYAIDENIVGNMLYTINLDVQNSILEHITQGNNIYLVADLLRVLVFQLDTTQKTRLQFYTVQTTTSGDKLMSISTDLQINENNTIIGLMQFTITNTNMNFNFYHNNGEIWLQNSADSSNMKADIALIYTMQCLLDSYFYSDTDGLCHRCLEGCFRCSNISVCEECAVNFTLENSDTECSCPFATVSGVCYDFESSPMKGCASAEVDSSSNEIICLQCSETQNLILSNNECICKSGFQRADSSANCSEILQAQTQITMSDSTGMIIGVVIGLTVLTIIGLVYYKYFHRRDRSMRQRPVDTQTMIFAPDFK